MTARDGHETRTILVIGYGNDLRGDDGAGRHVAEKIAAMCLPNVTVISAHQLGPEMAEPIAQSRLTIFVDAVPAIPLHHKLSIGPTVIRLHSSGCRPPILGHSPDPATLLFLARGLYGGRPRALFVAVPGVLFDHSETLTTETQRSVDRATQIVRRIAMQRVRPTRAIQIRVRADARQ